MKDNACFFDTNVLVYAFDEAEPQKRSRCKKLVETVFEGNLLGVISNQVLAELFFVLTEKIEKPINKEKAQTIVEGFIESINWKKINYSINTVKKATKSAVSKKIHFWDALIAETMTENELFTIYTENAKDFKKIRNIKAINLLK